jgi:DNA-binding PadR family transcriptional regulator
MAVAAPLSTETALMLALLQGPGYGLHLIERIQSRSRIRLPQGAVYPALRNLERRRLLRRWTVKPPGPGRPRIYFELTPRGVGAAQAQREAIARIGSARRPEAYSRREILAMRRRLIECGEVSAAASWLRRAGEASGL